MKGEPMTTKITKSLLPEAQYVNETSKKTQIVLHLTAGSNRPDYVIQGWAADATRVGTHFVIGGMSSAGDKAFDGAVYQAVPEEDFIYHLGLKGALFDNGLHDRSSIGIEICNWIQLTRTPDGKFLNYVNREVPASQVVTLGTAYRGYLYYHAITDAQIVALRSLIQELCVRHGIVLEKGKTYQDVDFAYDPKRAATQQITFHSAYRADKTDIAPMPNLIQMLNGLHV